jgi:hypothetical protein
MNDPEKVDFGPLARIMVASSDDAELVWQLPALG